MENVNESDDKLPTPSTNIETSLPSLQTELDPSKKNSQAVNRQKYGCTLQK
jgi:hypothetical protein